MRASRTSDAFAEVVARDLLERQEAVAVFAVVDEAGLERRLDARDHGLVDVALALFATLDLGLEVEQFLAVDDRQAPLFRLRGVDQHALHVHSIEAHLPGLGAHSDSSLRCTRKAANRWREMPWTGSTAKRRGQRRSVGACVGAWLAAGAGPCRHRTADRPRPRRCAPGLGVKAGGSHGRGCMGRTPSMDRGPRPYTVCAPAFRAGLGAGGGLVLAFLCHLRRPAAGSLGTAARARLAGVASPEHARAHDLPRKLGGARVNSGKSSTYRTNVERRIIGAKVAAVRHRAPADRRRQTPRCAAHWSDEESPASGWTTSCCAAQGRAQDPCLPRHPLGRGARQQGPRPADTRVALGDEVRCRRCAWPPSAPSRGAVPAREFPVLFEDEHLLAIDKPAGVAVHGGRASASA
jgi:hypothetical protein